MKTTLNIQGMHCASCVSRVEKSLQRLPGVTQAAVNLATQQAMVTHQPRAVGVRDLIKAVGQAGYEAKPEEPQSFATPARGRRGARIGRGRGGEEQAAQQRGLLMLCAGLTVGVLVLAMAWHSPESAQLQLLLASPVQLLLGYPFYRGAWRGLRYRRADMDSLVALGTSVAFGYSVVAVVRGQGVVYFDTAAVILVLVGVGRLLEAQAKHSVASAIHGLMRLQPPQAVVLRGDQEATVGVEQVQVGDALLVRPGGRVPVDGQVTQGQSTVDQSMFTGEAEPVAVEPGSAVIGGTVNQAGAFRMRATKTGQTMLLAQMVELVRQAQGSKAQIQRIVDLVASVFVPVVLAIALLTMLGWGLAGHGLYGLNAMVAVLIVACPCALGLATPTAIMVGTGLGAQHGILIKDAAGLERAGKLSHMILDKTGTLTLGRLEVKRVVAMDDAMPAEQVLALAASVESLSEHPLAKAIVDHADQQGITLHPVTDFKSITAAGVRGYVTGRSVVVGRISTLREREVEGVDALLERRDELLDANRTAVAVAVDGQAVGLIALADRLKPNAPAVVKQLRALGLRVILMTGDHPLTAESIANEVGIDPKDVLAQVMPADKQAKVAELQNQGHCVAMVGDGVNDAPALAAADIGIAMGSGTDIAMEAGHVVLVGGDLAGLPRAVRLSRATMRRIYAGLGWAFGYNLLLIPIAAAGLLWPMLAAGAMSFSSVSVVLNALWLKRAWKA